VVAAEGVEFKLPPQVEIISVMGEHGRPDLWAAMGALSGRGISRLFVEPGAALTEALLGGDLVDRFHVVTGSARVGPKGIFATSLGTIEGRIRAAGLTEVDRRILGDDNLTTFERG
jgi:diaminohydroxyphosphoribosylaminopyrimidine deaminase/5-amino-6-(5-phosphoribosylamino)uracil reductase